MKTTSKLTTFGLLATLAAASVAPALAQGYQSRSQEQTDKNNMRNLGIGAAAIAAYGLLNHNSAATLLGAAGAALAGSQYEKDRKQQSQDNYYYRDGRYGNGNSRSRNGSAQYGNDSYSNNGYNSGYAARQYGDNSRGNSNWNGSNTRYNTDGDREEQYSNGSGYDNNGSSNAWLHRNNQR